MSQTTVATGTFSSRKAANQAVQRLVSGGFARNSIELHPHDEDEGYDLEIHTRVENVKRAQRLIRGSSSMSVMGMRDVGYMASGAVQTARAHPFFLLGAGLLAGFVIYNLIPRPAGSKRSARRRQPSPSGAHARHEHR
ncbi:hypothetical protein [Microvirga makkahensis]|uniref:Uncharacterized protein n=1 Tax=Microvirga makkahensis TaxID=1128670 RepID=A0A7X3MMS5_9HYPH|nr:hypothetical protein [Microvirga makkahensis]MXQ09956.1 hypothetical protein [Microvirga makkahensis]